MQSIAPDWPLSTPKDPLRQRLWRWGSAKIVGLDAAWTLLQSATAAPARFQAKLLGRILTANQRSAYGRAHGFDRLHSVAAYQARVPQVDDDTLAPWLAEIAAGRGQVLTQDKVLGLQASAGHSGTPRRLPVTASLLRQEGLALRTIMAEWLQHEPSLLDRPVYLEQPPRLIQAGQADGEDDTGAPPWVADGTTLARGLRRHLTDSMRIGGGQAEQPDDGAWLQETLPALLEAEQLGLMLVRSPQRLNDLLQRLEAALPQLLEALPIKRATGIMTRLERAGSLQARVLWPALRAIACWQDGSATAALPQLRRFCADVPLLAAPISTQAGTLTLPLRQARPAPLAITSHFFEFIDLEARRQPPLLAHALRPGGLYLPLLTTAAGLYRYQLNAAVRCSGHWQGIPLLNYVDRTRPVSRLNDEFLSPYSIQQALDEVAESLQVAPRFALCVPDLRQVPHRYVLYLESEAEPATLVRMTEQLEARLCRDHAYWCGRQAGKLQALTLVSVVGGWDIYVRVLTGLGLSHWRIAPTALDLRPVWHEAFTMRPS